jgi:hypothetical protein
VGLPPGVSPELIAQASDAASQATSLADFFRLLLTPPEPPDRLPPGDAFHHPKETAQHTFAGMFWALRDIGIPQPLAYFGAMLAAMIVAAGGVLGQLLFWLLKNVGAAFAEDTLELVDDARKALDPTVANISVTVLNELLGTDYVAAHLATGDDVQAHRDRAGEIGALFHNTLISEFQSEGDVTPEAGMAAAHRMSGFLINFGVATAIVSVVGDILSLGKFEQFRELGVEVARNLGLGRLNRQAMKPLVDIMIAQPYKWWFNTRFHPTQFKISEVINPFTATLMPVEDIFAAADLDGYTHDKVQKLIELHQKRLTPADAELLARWKFWDGTFARDYITKLGFPEQLADTVVQIEQFKRVDARLNKLIDTLETNVLDGHITIEEFTAVLDTMPLTPNEQGAILTTVKYKAKSPHKALTFAQIQKAFEDGMIDDTELRDRLSRQGYSDADVDILEVQTLLAQAKLAAAAAKTAAAASKKKAKASGTPPPAPAPAG